MSDQTVRLVALMCTICVLLGLNLGAAFLRVPLLNATVSDAVTALVALVGVIMVDVKKPPTPPGLTP